MGNILAAGRFKYRGWNTIPLHMGEKMEKKNVAYIVECSDGTFYTGWTNHLTERIRAHNDGKGAKYTKSRRPVKLIYWEEFETKQEAMSREAKIKQLTRQEKEKLIEKGCGNHEEECI